MLHKVPAYKGNKQNSNQNIIHLRIFIRILKSIGEWKMQSAHLQFEHPNILRTSETPEKKFDR